MINLNGSQRIRDYQDGLEDGRTEAWEIAKSIINHECDTEAIFNEAWASNVMTKFTEHEAKEKIIEYNKQIEQKETINKKERCSMTAMEEMKLNRPDVSLGNRIKAVFDDDPQVSVEYVNAAKDQCAKVILRVTNSEKASAIRRILPYKYDISLPVEVQVGDDSEMSGDIVKAAFEGNPHFKDYVEITNELMQETYHVCIFKDEVIKFINDNASSLNGYEFRLMQDLAGEVAPVPKLIYTTDDGLPYKN